MNCRNFCLYFKVLNCCCTCLSSAGSGSLVAASFSVNHFSIMSLATPYIRKPATGSRSAAYKRSVLSISPPKSAPKDVSAWGTRMLLEASATGAGGAATKPSLMFSVVGEGFNV